MTEYVMTYRGRLADKLIPLPKNAQFVRQLPNGEKEYRVPVVSLPEGARVSVARGMDKTAFKNRPDVVLVEE